MALDRTRVAEAAARIAPFVTARRSCDSHSLDEWVGAEVFVKAEHLQRIGAFKYRGATNAVQALSPRRRAPRRRRALLGQPCGRVGAGGTDAGHSRVRRDARERIGREARRGRALRRRDHVVREHPRCPTRAVLAEVLERTGAVEIHPFDDEQVIAGAGTAALELIEEVPDLDVVVTPVGGGGLCSGTCLAVAPVRVIGGSPRDRARSIADGLRTGCSPRTEAILARARRRTDRR